MMFRRSIALIGITALCACTVGPDFQPPAVDAPAKFEGQQVLNLLARPEGASAEHPALPSAWWKGFQDELLSALVEAAINRNPEIEAASARLMETAAQVDLAAAGDAPRIGLEFDGGSDWERELSTSRATERDDNLSGLLSLALPLDLFGRTERAEQAAVAEFEAARHDLRRTVLRVTSEAATEYVRIRGNQQQLALLRASVELQEQTLRIVKSRVAAGLAPELDLRRAEAEVETLRAEIPDLVQDLAASRHRLSSLTGSFHEVGSSIVDGEPSIPRYRDGVPDLVPLEVLRLRPDVQQAEAQLKSAIARIGIARAEWYPEVTALAEIGIGRRGLGGQDAVNLLIASVSGLIEQFLIDGGARRANVKIAEARASQALAQYRQSMLEAVEEVERSLANIAALDEKRESLEKAVAASARSAHQADILYRQGLTSFLDVVDAQRVLASTQQRLAESETAYASQIADLFRVLGAPEKPRAE